MEMEPKLEGPPPPYGKYHNCFLNPSLRLFVFSVL